MSGERQLGPDDDIQSWFSAVLRDDSAVALEEALARRGLRPEDQDEDLLIDLIDIEVDHRKKHGEQPSPEEYRRRFPRLSERIDKLFGVRYSIRTSIGKGGLGEVFEAYDHLLRREVALKRVRSEFDDSLEHRTRLEREAKITGELEHPNIVPIHDRGRDPAGRPFYVMRLIHSRRLKDSIKNFHKTNWSRNLGGRVLALHRLVRQLVAACRAIAYANSKGIIHYDLNPSNIMVGDDDEAQVLDWGLAWKVNERVTSAAPKAGTPQYMSPEQAGSGAIIDHRTDVYCLGATLYHILTGRAPILSKSIPRALHRAREGIIRAPRERRPSAMIPRPLEAICMQAMALNPVDRYPDCKALADDLERWLADEPVSAWCEPLFRRALRWMRRHRTAMIGAAMAGLIGVIGLAAVAAVQARANRELQTANEKTSRALDAETRAKNDATEALAQSEEARKRAQAVLGFLKKDVLAAARPEGQEGGLGVEVTVRKAVDAADPKIAGAFQDQPIVEADVRDTLGQTYLYLGEALLAIRQIERALELRQKRLGPDHTDTLASRNNLAAAYLAAGRTHDAITMIEVTLKLCESKLGPDHPDTLRSRNNLAEAYLDAGRTDDTIKMHEATLKQRESKLGTDHPDTLRSRNNLAAAYLAAGRTDDAITMHQGTLKQRESKLGPDHPSTLASRNNLAAAYLAAGRTDDAIKMFEATLKLSESKLGLDHPHTLASRDNLAAAYRAAGRTDDAIKMHEATLKQEVSKQGPDHPSTLISRNNLAAAYRAAGRIDDAIKMHEATLKLSESKLGLDHPDTFISRANLAKAYRAAGQLDRAISLFEQALQGFRGKVGPDHPYTLTTEQHLVDAYTAAGQDTGAEPLLRNAWGRARQQFGPADPRTAAAMAAVGSNLIQQRKWVEAETILRECLAISQKAQPDDWSTFHTRSQLGGSLLGQGRYGEAEPLVVPGYEGMKAREARIPAAGKSRLAKAAQRVVRLYEGWGQPGQAAAWKQKLGLADLPADVFATP
jgi:tetratricopeptide (TPR) repeat protein/tRNA A-37 threonylcarbamoyl transferase component Bud32